jgi:hypothetical protein
MVSTNAQGQMQAVAQTETNVLRAWLRHALVARPGVLRTRTTTRRLIFIVSAHLRGRVLRRRQARYDRKQGPDGVLYKFARRLLRIPRPPNLRTMPSSQPHSHSTTPRLHLHCDAQASR